MMKLVLWAAAAAAGVAAACQASANAALSGRAGLGAALLLNSVVVLFGSLAVLTVTGGPRQLPALSGAPPHHYVAGLCGFFIIASTAFAFPRLGAAKALALMVAAQGVTGLVIDHLGLWGMPTVAATGSRLLGVALLIAGVILLRR
jgi:transporter family-2 protein